MEEDRGSPALVLSPSFREAAAEDAGDRLTSTVDSPQKISAIPEHQYEVEEDDDDDTSEDFEFAFVIKDPESIPAITADEIFSNGQIRSVYPVFNRDLLLADGGGDGGDAVEEKAVRMPLRRLLIEERNASSASASSSSEMGELEGIDPGTYCVWRPGSVPPSPARCKKSCSTGSSFRWRIRDLVRRSRSDGKEKFVFLAAEEKKPSRSSEKKKSEGEAAAKGEGEKKEKGNEVTDVDMVTGHRIYYRSRNRGGQTAKGGWRSFLPYKPDRVGFPANVNGLSPSHHPY
ncbi:uncharacterized protein LOC103719437 [Phoenix dactylifera]|uniref:Uncharacterized protein LOC103719437 n=1 Tax=Phoenix dactylifera TaxID=42345 RepID=A0A8B7CUX3_PHODC|nr:uncharacterized protein LOC103719437 [Phoenix dactylifera]